MKNKKLITYSLALFLAIGVSGYFVYTYYYNRLLKATSEGLSFGKAAGAQISQSLCMFGLQLKYQKCETTECELSARGYISACMEAARRDNFCSKIPTPEETKRTVRWASETCATNNLGNAKCLNYINQFVSTCAEQTRGEKRTSLENFQDGFKRGLENKSTP